MGNREISVIEGNSFVVADDLGDIVTGTPHGLYYADTRFLSEFTLRLNGREPLLLSSGNRGGSCASFYLTNPAGEDLPQGSVSLVRDRSVCVALHEDITLENHSDRQLAVKLDLCFAADFADVFEVRGGKPAKLRQISQEFGPGGVLSFTYRREEFSRSARVSFSQPAQMEDNRAIFDFTLGPKEQWLVHLDVRPVVDRIPIPDACIGVQPDTPFSRLVAGDFDEGGQSDTNGEQGIVAKAPALITEDARMQFAYDRAVLDVGALRLKVDGEHYLLAAGLPWYMAMFGRDSIIAALQTLLLGPELATGTLRALAHYQSRRTDPYRDEEPGKIPHEIRFGELSCLEEVPHSRYYGTVDATPLYLVLLSETFRWTGNLDLVQELLPNAEAALEWIERHGDLDGDGFVEYARRSIHGQLNQGWKDSVDPVQFADGTIAKAPIALAEVQGYVYDAKARMAEIYRALGRLELAESLDREAGELKKRFDEAFWMPEEGFYAMALDGEKRKVSAITSNPGHCLWSGIISEERAAAVVERLMAPDMFNGWGIRTMSCAMRGYNPISYHNGSVWPHDNSLIIVGLRRYGFDREAEKLIGGLLDASSHFPSHRLPELFAGYERRNGSFPVEYLGANSPQAWASGAIVLMLQTMLGLDPRGDEIRWNPLPGIQSTCLLGLRHRQNTRDVSCFRPGAPGNASRLATGEERAFCLPAV
ncbi:MAG: amylo-alpha-1,6-glucosidase [Chloroflexi bacterium]|nr:amylo-alpha-1,6-glucosidase [Chloroflexota bacterium]